MSTPNKEKTKLLLKGKPILDFYLYGSIHIGLGAMSMTIMSFFLLGYNLKQALPYFIGIFFGTIAFYSLHRIYDLKSSMELSDAPKYKSIFLLKDWIKLSIGISAIGGAITLFFLPFEIFLILIIGAFFTAWYSIPFWRSGKKLKEIAQIKIFVIAVVWGLVTAGLPGYLSGETPLTIVLLFMERSIFLLALTLPFDVRDYLIDKKQDVRTIPAWMGKRNSIKLAVFLLVIIVGGLNLILFQLGIYEEDTILFLIATNLITSIFVGFSSKITNDYYFTGLLDGILIMQPIALLCIK